MFFENCLPLIVYRGGNYGKLFTICHLKVIFTEYHRVLVLFYESLTSRSVSLEKISYTLAKISHKKSYRKIQKSYKNPKNL